MGFSRCFLFPWGPSWVSLFHHTLAFAFNETLPSPDRHVHHTLPPGEGEVAHMRNRAGLSHLRVAGHWGGSAPSRTRCARLTARGNTNCNFQIHHCSSCSPTPPLRPSLVFPAPLHQCCRRIVQTPSLQLSGLGNDPCGLCIGDWGGILVNMFATCSLLRLGFFWCLAALATQTEITETSHRGPGDPWRPERHW